MTELSPMYFDPIIAFECRRLDLPPDMFALPVAVGPYEQDLGISGFLLYVFRNALLVLELTISARGGLEDSRLSAHRVHEGLDLTVEQLMDRCQIPTAVLRGELGRCQMSEDAGHDDGAGAPLPAEVEGEFVVLDVRVARVALHLLSALGCGYHDTLIRHTMFFWPPER